jgi:hypothetical protein
VAEKPMVNILHLTVNLISSGYIEYISQGV